MKGLVIFYSFLISTFMTVAGFMDTKSYPELISAVIFFPIAFYFGMLILPKKRQAKIVIDPVLDIIPDSLNKVKNKDYDPERRKFLKLIGAAVGSLFLMTIFTKSTEAAFFGSMPGPGTVAVKNLAGAQINPAEQKPTDGYNITEIDDLLTDTYYGYVNKDGAWYIQKETASGAYRYIKGTTDFTTNWTGRTGLTYDYFNNIF